MDGRMMMRKSLPGRGKAPDLLHRHSLCGRAASHFTGALTPRTCLFPTSNACRQVQSLDTEALPKFGKEEEARSLRRGFTAVLSHITQMCVQVTLGCRWIVLLLLASTGLADTTDYTRRSQQ